MSNLDNRNQQSWNIYNEVKPHSPHDRKHTKSTSPKKPRKSESQPADTSPKPSSDKQDAPQTPSRNSKVSSVPASPMYRMEMTGDMMWPMYSNMVRSIDNVFNACIQMEYEEGCDMAYKVLYVRMLEFQRLLNYFEAQRRFVYGQPISWEIPKGYVSAQAQDFQLNATAEAFQPASFNGDVPNSKLPAASSASETRADALESSSVVPSVLLKAVMSGEDGTGAPPVVAAPKTYRERAMTESMIGSQKAAGAAPLVASAAAAAGKPLQKAGRSNSTTTAPTLAKPNSVSRGTSYSTSSFAKENQAWEDQTDRIVREEMNKVMKAAERMVEEAELEEEQQWAAMHGSQHQPPHNKAKKQMGPLELHIDSSESTDTPHRQHHNHFSAPPTGSMVSPPSFMQQNRKSSNASSTVISGTMTPNTGAHSGAKSPFSRTGSPYGLAHSNSANAFLTPSGSVAGRSLHDKFSSPDRKKCVSPDEARRRSDAKMQNAAINRDLNNAEKIKKAKVSSDRVKVVEQSNARKSAQLHQQIEERQNQADVRRQGVLNTKKERAGNENTKVEEVQFINSLNSEGFADELNKKLAEAEAKALSADVRRTEHLQNKSLQQRRKNTKKAQQVSEYKMETEKLTILRYEAMKERMLAVEARKQERLALKAQPHNTAVLVAVSEQENKTSSASNRESVSESLLSSAVRSSDNKSKATSASHKSVVIADPPGEEKDSPSSASNAKAKSKRQKKKALLEQQQLQTQQQVEVTPASGLSIETVKQEAKSASSEAIVSPLAVQIIGDCYQNMTNSLTKRVLLSSRMSFIEAAKCESVPAPMDASPRASFVVPTGQSEFTGMSGLLNSFVSTYSALDGQSGINCGRHFVLARQLLGAQVPINNTATAVFREDSASNSTTPTHGSERQVRFNIPLVLCTVDLSSSQSVSQFISEGGVLLLRVLLGYEVGVLSSEITFVEVLNCAVDPTLGKSLGQIIFELVRISAQTSEGLAQLYAAGVPVLLSDVATVLIAVQDTLSKDCIHVKGSTSVAASEDTKSAGGTLTLPYCVSTLLPLVVLCLSVVVEAPPVLASSESTGGPFKKVASASSSFSLTLPSANKGFTLSSAAVDAFVWYLFSSNLYTALCDSLRVDVLCLQYRQSYANTFSTSSSATVAGAGSCAPEYRKYSSVEAQESIIHSCGLIAAIADRLRLSGRPTGPDADQVVKSLIQLSPSSHSHPQGKKIISLLRRSEVVPVLISLVHALIVDYEQVNQETLHSATAPVQTGVGGAASTTQIKSRRGNVKPSVDFTSGPMSIANQFRVYAAIVGALHNIAAADISLVQSLSKTHQTLIVSVSSYLIRSHVNSLDDGNTINVFASSTQPSSPTGSLKSFTKSDAEESIRRLLLTLTLCCLRCNDLQRECSSTASLTPLFCPVIQSIQQQTADKAAKPSANGVGGAADGEGIVSLLVTLCRLSNKFYKDRKFKQALHPCLIAMSLDVDGNINIVRSEGKIPQIVKYLEFYIFEHNKYFVSANSDASVVDSVVDQETKETRERLRASNMAMVVNFSRLLPSDSWNTALLTFN